MKSAIPQIRSLTGARGLAAWWVVLYHFREYMTWLGMSTVGFLSHGYLAVDFFFVLSGFVIGLNYLDDFRLPDFRRTARFLGLRLARIYPLHIVMLCAFLVNPLAVLLFSSSGVLAPGSYDPAYFVASVFLVQNWGFTHPLDWNVPAWSISTEWFAYLMFPASAWAALRFVRRPSQAMIVIVLLLLALIGVNQGSDNLGDRITSLGLVRCILEFNAGLCIVRLRGLHAGPSWPASLGVLACAAGYSLLPIPDYVIVPAGFCCFVYALADDRSILSRVFSLRWLELVGLVSYSTYMVHFFVKIWVKYIMIGHGWTPAVPVIVYIVATAVASVVLYRWVEAPGRRAFRNLLPFARRPAQTSAAKASAARAQPFSGRGSGTTPRAGAVLQSDVRGVRPRD